MDPRERRFPVGLPRPDVLGQGSGCVQTHRTLRRRYFDLALADVELKQRDLSTLKRASRVVLALPGCEQPG